MEQIIIIQHSPVSKVKQIEMALKKDIESGLIPNGYQLPSINLFSEKYAVARDTVEKAYKLLKQSGHLQSAAGKGYYANWVNAGKKRVLFIFNKLSAYKKTIYDNFVATLGEGYEVNYFTHHYNAIICREIIEANLGAYDFYVVMPHFEAKNTAKEIAAVFENIPPGKLLLLDRKYAITGKKYMSVFQDFSQDFFDGLASLQQNVSRFTELHILFPPYSSHPREVINGLQKFSRKFGMRYSIIEDLNKHVIKKGNIYIAITESELATLIRNIKATRFIIGTDIGIFSLNETALKELLDITVITTDFKQMGITAAQLIRESRMKHIKNPSLVIKRNSL